MDKNKVEKVVKEKKKKVASKALSLWGEFKAFISRGSVIDMAVGIIVGSAFTAIVTSVVNALLTLCTWGIPGGIAGLVTVLPALNDSQKLPQSLVDLGLSETIDVATYSTLSSTQAAMYTKHGALYYYNALPIIDWGNILTAVISFIIIALVLFTILKVVKKIRQKKLDLEAKLKEQYFVLHPEERPLPVDPSKPVVTEVQLLGDIKKLLETTVVSSNANTTNRQ